MRSSLLKEITLYRFRYLISYGLVIIFLAILLLTDINKVPDGLREAEIQSSIASNSLNLLAPIASDVINLPYHLFQKLSIGLFGLSPLSIRLPSIVIGFVSCLILGIALHLWFRRNIATIALLLATTSVPFVAMARSGTAAALYMLLLLVIMLGAALLTMRKQGTFIWKLLVIAAGALLLYMPLGFYAVATLMIAGVFHPHVRYQIKRTKWWQVIIIAVMIGLLLLPIILSSLDSTQTAMTLLGINELQSKLHFAALIESIISIFESLFMFHKPTLSDVITPFLSLTYTLLVLFGLVQSIIHRHAARSYLLHLWLLVSIPLLILNPTSFPLLFVPCMFLMAIGLETFMKEWYEVFPRNPYARIGALIPLSLIVLGMITVATSRYFYGFYYADTRDVYSTELSVVRQTLKPHVATELVVPKDQLGFYDILRSKYPLLTVSSSVAPEKEVGERIVLASSKVRINEIPDFIRTSMYSKDGVILRVYTDAR